MTTKALIQEQLNNIPEEYLEELYAVIQRFVEVKSAQSEMGILSKLSKIKIQGPEDFSANLDLYLTGDKFVVED